MKNNKGITLIALIITIIVMLILVAVTVTFALQGGLFDNAKEAAKETEKHAIYETVVSAMELDNNQDIDYVLTANKAKIVLENDGKKVKDPTIEPNNDPPRAILTVTGKYGTYQIEINGREIKFLNDSNPAGGGGGGDNSEVPPELEAYILGPDKKGRPLMMSSDSIFDGENFVAGEYENDALVANKVTAIGSFGMRDQFMYLYITYNNDGNIYRFATTADFSSESPCYMTVPNLEVAKVPTDDCVGKTVQIADEDYIVLYAPGEYGEKAQLIRADVLVPDSIQLGCSDNLINWSDPAKIAAADILTETVENNKSTYTKGADNGALSRLEKAIYSYNNVVANLNKKCYELIHSEDSSILETDVRSVGSNPLNKNQESGIYSSDLLATVPYDNDPAPTGIFNNVDGIGGKGTDNNWKYDIDRMIYLEMMKDIRIMESANNDGDGDSYIYWLASRIVLEENITYPNITYYIIESTWAEPFIYINDDQAGAEGYSDSFGVRPVVSVSEATLNTLLGN